METLSALSLIEEKTTLKDIINLCDCFTMDMRNTNTSTILFQAQVLGAALRDCSPLKLEERKGWNMCQLSQHIHHLGGFAELKVLIVLICVQAVSTASCERMFSALKIIKTRLRSNMGDGWLDG